MAEDPLKTPTLRLFLAIPFHEVFFQEISCVLESLSRKITGIRYVNPQQVHLTLHFFGSTPAAQVEQIDASLRKLALIFTPFQVCLGQIGGFPSLRHPKVIWMGIQEKTGQLSLLYQMIQREVQQLGFEIEHRPIHPHVTLGRIQKRCGDLEPMLSKIKFDLPTQEKVLDHFVLYQSHCFPEGARYEVLKTYPMQKTG